MVQDSLEVSRHSIQASFPDIFKCRVFGIYFYGSPAKAMPNDYIPLIFIILTILGVGVGVKSTKPLTNLRF